MKRRRPATSLTIATALLAAGILTGCATQQATPATDGVFIHITAGPEDAHEVLMALKMATIMVESHDVLIYADIDAVHVLTTDAPKLTMEPFGSAQRLIDQLLASDVPIYACPGCLKAAGKTPTDLKPGIQVANKQAFFDFTDGRILTLDY